MPIIPVTSNAPRIGNLPGIRTPSADPRDFGAGLGAAIAGAGQDIAAAGASAAFGLQRLKIRKESEEADNALTRYAADMDALLNGSQAPDGSSAPGIRQRTLADAAGSAADFTAAEKAWFKDPESPYAKMSPGARAIFERSASRYSARFRQAAVEHELAQSQAQRKIDAESAAAVNDSLARRSFDSTDFDAFSGEASLRYADAQLHGQVTVNPDGTRSFSSKAAEDLHRDAAARKSFEYRRDRALHLLSLAADLPAAPAQTDAPDPAANLLSRAEADAAQLPTEMADQIRAASARVSSARETRSKAAAYDAERQAALAREQEVARLDKLDQQWMTSENPDTDAYIRELSKSPATAEANQRIAAALRHKAAQASEAAKSRQELDRQRSESSRRAKIVALGSGFAIDAAGRPAALSPQEIITIANADFAQAAPDSITEAQRSDMLKYAKSLEDSRVAAFHRRAVNELLPGLAAAVVRDGETGDFSVSQKKRANGEPVYSPNAKTPYTDTYQDPRANKQSSQRILLSQAVEAMNTIKDSLALDPKMDTDSAFRLLRAQLEGTLAESDRLTIEDSLRAQAQRNADLRANFRLKSLTPLPQTANPDK